MTTRREPGVARRALFLAYTYRWVRERDDYPLYESLKARGLISDARNMRSP